jgi:hypothetical protein
MNPDLVVEHGLDPDRAGSGSGIEVVERAGRSNRVTKRPAPGWSGVAAWLVVQHSVHCGSQLA